MPFAKCHYAECHYAECHYAECHHAECHFAEELYVECRCAELRYSGGYYAEWRLAECRYAECRGADLATSLTFDNLSQFWPFLVWMRMTHLETVGLTKERSFLGWASSFYFEQLLIIFLMIF